jgi:hypothetical protein
LLGRAFYESHSDPIRLKSGARTDRRIAFAVAMTASGRQRSIGCDTL